MLDADSSSAPQRKQPRWIEVETLEPIYSVLGSQKSSGSISSEGSRQPEKDIVISSKTATARQRFPTCPKKPPIPPNYRNHQSKQLEEEVIYSVVNKVRGVVGISVETEGSSNSRREELENWLRTASRERGAMYNNSGRNRDDHNEWRRESSVSTPRGIVGLVGPYR